MSEDNQANGNLAELFKEGVKVGSGIPYVVNDKGVPNYNPFIVMPEGMNVEDMSKFYPKQRIDQTASFIDVGSFVEYVNRYKTDLTMMFAELSDESGTFLAIMDYHAPAPSLKPGYKNHRAMMNLRQTTAFKTWLAADKKKMNQVEFATWLEDNAPLFTDPPGATLLELVQTLNGKSDVSFGSGVRLDNGSNKLTYEEIVTMTGVARGGEMQLPTTLTAQFPPFEGCAPYVVRARLKYRIEGKKLSIWFETIALPAIVRDGIMSVARQIAAPQLTADAKALAVRNWQTLVDTEASPEIVESARIGTLSGTGIAPLLGQA